MSDKMTQCKTCGADIAKSAKRCPACGAKNKKSPVLTILIVVLVLFFIGSCSSGGDEPEKVGDVPAPEAPVVEAPKTEFGVGEIVELNNILVTMTKVSENTGANFVVPADGNVFVVCEFEIENKSTADVAVSSVISFEAYCDDYATQMSFGALTTAELETLDGTVAPDKKLKGAIGYELPKDWAELEIKFTPNFWSSKDITFVATK